MFSGASTNYNMDNPGLYSSDEEAFNTESLRLLKENAKLRKLMGLMQENVELRCTLKEHERKAQIITPPGQHKKDHNGMKEKKNTEISQHHYLREEAQMVNSGPHLDLENIKKCQRIVGELAFQLDRRILSAIFLEQQRMYGYRVPNIKEKIIQVTTIPATGKVDEKLRYELYQRYNHTMDELRKFGYNPTVHPHFTESPYNDLQLSHLPDYHTLYSGGQYLGRHRSSIPSGAQFGEEDCCNNEEEDTNARWTEKIRQAIQSLCSAGKKEVAEQVAVNRLCKGELYIIGSVTKTAKVNQELLKRLAGGYMSCGKTHVVASCNVVGSIKLIASWLSLGPVSSFHVIGMVLA
ncbi:uncharacterized protein LOC142292409 [Anomaloglossus baeobatrachus]|uniref:uncharacterized protein LOC142292409 n=1 Tax=Anomaloglossus baeobatrachus TaxID=238106 RepID=UPI003F505C09